MTLIADKAYVQREAISWFDVIFAQPNMTKLTLKEKLRIYSHVTSV